MFPQTRSSPRSSGAEVRATVDVVETQMGNRMTPAKKLFFCSGSDDNESASLVKLKKEGAMRGSALGLFARSLHFQPRLGSNVASTAKELLVCVYPLSIIK